MNDINHPPLPPDELAAALAAAGEPSGLAFFTLALHEPDAQIALERCARAASSKEEEKVWGAIMGASILARSRGPLVREKAVALLNQVAARPGLEEHEVQNARRELSEIEGAAEPTGCGAVLPLAWDQAAQRLAGKDGARASEALHSVVHHDWDVKRARDACLRELASDEAPRRRAACEALGCLSATHRRLEKDEIEAPLLRARELHPELAPVVEAALGEFALRARAGDEDDPSGGREGLVDFLRCFGDYRTDEEGVQNAGELAAKSPAWADWAWSELQDFLANRHASALKLALKEGGRYCDMLEERARRWLREISAALRPAGTDDPLRRRPCP